MKVDTESLIIKFDDEKVYPLKEIFFSDDLISIRKNLSNTYVIIKIGKRLYTTTSKIVGKPDFKGKESLCLSCSNFWNCPKVTDKELLSLPFTMEKYNALMRLEKYPFISFGLETYSFFYVWECESYSKLQKKKKTENVDEKKKAMEKKYPLLKELNQAQKEVKKANETKENKRRELEKLIRLVS